MLGRIVIRALSVSNTSFKKLTNTERFIFEVPQKSGMFNQFLVLLLRALAYKLLTIGITRVIIVYNIGFTKYIVHLSDCNVILSYIINIWPAFIFNRKCIKRKYSYSKKKIKKLLCWKSYSKNCWRKLPPSPGWVIINKIC